MIAKDKIINILKINNIDYKVYTHEEIPTVEQAMKKVDFDINYCMKTIAFKYNDNFIFACLLAKDKVDYSKLCNVLNLSRSKLKKACDAELECKYGFESGGIAPFSIDENIIVVVDDCFMNDTLIYCGSGLRNQTIQLKYKDLLKINNSLSKKISR